ncbi:MAG: polysaccharide lyase family 7 protein [Opitutaceae bacterium]
MPKITSRPHWVLLPLLGICLLPSCSSVDEPVTSTNTVDSVIASNKTATNSQASNTVVWKDAKTTTPDKNSNVVSTKPISTPVAQPMVKPITEPAATMPVVKPVVITKPAVVEPVAPKPAVKPAVKEAYSMMPELTKPATQPVPTQPAAKPAIKEDYSMMPAITQPATKPVITKPAITTPITKRAPYDLPVFQAVLDDSKLQAPESGTLAKQGKLPGFSHDCFYLNDAGQMVFVTDHSSIRSELRQMEEWVTGSSTPKEMEGRVQLDAPTANMSDNYTFMQIHDSLKVPNAPLIRLEWRRDYRGEYDHIWATIRTEITPKKYLKVDLGPRPDRAFNAKISVVNNQLSVSIDNQTPIKAHDVSHWDGLSSYFKAGAYSRDSGTVRVAFEALTYRY